MEVTCFFQVRWGKGGIQTQAVWLHCKGWGSSLDKTTMGRQKSSTRLGIPESKGAETHNVLPRDCDRKTLPLYTHLSLSLTSHPLTPPRPCLVKEEAMTMERTLNLSEQPRTTDPDGGR